jgi:putative ABC transport system permease protein
MFKARRGRTALTILGMGIGIGAILFLVALGYGLQNLLLESITTSDSLITLDVSGNPAEGINLSKDKVGEITQIKGVSEVIPANEIRSQLKYQETVSEATVVATKPQFIKLDGKKMASGLALSDNKPEGVVMSSAFYKIFGRTADEMLGKKVSISLFLPKMENGKERSEKTDITSEFEIVGFVENEDLVFYANSSALENELTSIDYSRIKVKCSDAGSLEEVKNKLSGEGMVVSSLSDTVKEVNKMFMGVKGILAFFGLIALLVSAIGMFNTMTVTLLERTKEIGIMKAIGASERDVLLMFIIESSIMGFLGGLVGIILGILAGSTFNGIINIVAWRMGGKAITLFSYPLWFLAFILVFAAAIGFITGVGPARRASSIDPLEAFRAR